MFVDGIDKFIDDILNKFNNYITSKISKYTIKDFSKKNKEMYEDLAQFVDTLKMSDDIKHQTQISQDDIDIIVDTFKRYLITYLLIMVAYRYEWDDKSYITNLVNLSMSYSYTSSKFKVKYIYTSSYNATLVEFYKTCNQIKRYLTNDKSDLPKAKEFFNNFDGNVLDTMFYKQDNKQLLEHNIIKSLILINLYINSDKININHIVMTKEKENAEYRYIDIILPKHDYVDFASILASLPFQYLEYARDAYYLFEEEVKLLDVKNTIIDNDDKILYLFDTLFTPVLEDFLLYHKDTYKYDIFKDEKKDNSKIKYIVNKIDETTEYYSNVVTDNINIYNKVRQNFFQPLYNRRVILHNQLIDVDIIHKLQMIGKKVIENNTLYYDFLQYKTYPYINFKTMGRDGFSITTAKTIDAIRDISFDQINKRKYLQTRVGGEYTNINVVGVFIGNPYCTIASTVKPLTTDILEKIIDNKFSQNLFNTYYDNKYLLMFDSINTTNIKEYLLSICNNTGDILFDILKNKISTKVKFYVANTLIEKYLFRYSYTNINRIREYQKYLNVLSKNQQIQLVKYIYNYTKDAEDIEDDKENEVPLNVSIVKRQSVDKPTYICQHVISWTHIKKAQAYNQKLSIELLRKFTQRYVYTNEEDKYICNSCNYLLDIEKYVEDGEFTSDGRFIVFHEKLSVPLEDIPFYARYKHIINNIDKLIEKLGYIYEIPYYIGNSYVSVENRREITKQVFDMILENNKHLNKIWEKRSSSVLDKYGITSELYMFELSNNMFEGKNKESEFYNIRVNNVISYVMLFMLLNVDEYTLKYFKGNKLCNYSVFDKYKDKIIGNIKIYLGNNKTVNLNKYLLLSYLLYMFACSASRYNLWRGNYKGIEKIKITINTMVDMLNSILEVKQGVDIFEIFKLRFYTLLDKYMSNLDLINDYFIKPILTPMTVPPDVLNIYTFKQDGIYSIQPFFFKYYPKILPPVLYYKSKKYVKLRSYINEATNCPTGQFHVWNGILCTLCNTKIEDVIKIKNTPDDKLLNKYLKYINDLYHTTPKEIILSLESYNTRKYEILNELLSKASDNNEFNKQIYLFMKNSYETNKESYINSFINLLKSMVGDININGENIYLDKDIYIIDHNYTGKMLKTNIIIDGKHIKYQYNHPEFKRNVLYYTNLQTGRVDVYYDLNTYQLLGYKEANKNIVHMQHTINRYIVINYSVKSMIDMMGYKYYYVRLINYYPEHLELFSNEKIYNYIINNINSERNNILKFIINDLQQKINRFAYKKHDELDPLAVKYKNKLNDMSTSIDDETYVFDRIINIKNIIIFQPYTETLDIDISRDNLVCTELRKYDNSGNVLLFYLISELEKLLDINRKVNMMPYLIIDLFIYIYREYSSQMYIANEEISRFKHILLNQGFLVDLANNGYTPEDFTEGLYGDYVDPTEQPSNEKQEEQIDLEESINAIDIDYMMNDGDNADDFESDMLYSIDYNTAPDFSAND